MDITGSKHNTKLLRRQYVHEFITILATIFPERIFLFSSFFCAENPMSQCINTTITNDNASSDNLTLCCPVLAL